MTRLAITLAACFLATTAAALGATPPPPRCHLVEDVIVGNHLHAREKQDRGDLQRSRRGVEIVASLLISSPCCCLSTAFS